MVYRWFYYDKINWQAARSDLITHDQGIKVTIIIEPRHERTCFMLFENNKDTDQPAHLRSLISIFFVRCLDSIMNILSPATILLKKESEKISNDQELIQSDPTSCPQNQKGNN